MKDAFGSTFMIQILLVFIIIYVGFIGIAVNYGRAFRIKNHIIDYLETNEVNNLKQASENINFTNYVNGILTDFNYRNSNICNGFENSETEMCIGGVIVEREETTTKHGVNHIYYKVNTLVGFDLGFLNTLLSLGREKSSNTIAGYFRISGETRVIVTN